MGGSRKRWGPLPDHPQSLLDDHREAEGEEQAQRRIGAVEAPQEQPLDRHPEARHKEGRGDEGGAEAGHPAQLDRQVGADRVERAVSQVDDPTQAEDERQAERDQEVVDAQEQAVHDLLEDEDPHHRGPVLGGGGRTAVAGRTRAVRPAGMAQAKLQGFSWRVGAMTSSGSLDPGTGGLTSAMSHLSTILSLALGVSVYISKSI